MIAVDAAAAAAALAAIAYVDTVNFVYACVSCACEAIYIDSLFLHLSFVLSDTKIDFFIYSNSKNLQSQSHIVHCIARIIAMTHDRIGVFSLSSSH